MIESTTNVHGQLRRRRKRARTNQELEERAHAHQKLAQDAAACTDFSAEDAVLAFLDQDGDLLADRKPSFRSLPVLLEERRSRGWNGVGATQLRNRRDWQTQMLLNCTKKPNPGIGRRQWRPFGHRAISFTSLGTPHYDAVLALDRSGSYVLSLGSKDDDYASPGLALRFYGIPSPSSMVVKSMTKFSKAPLLQCTPLLHGIGDLAQNSAGVAEQAIFSFQGNVSPETTPVTILISRDWKCGVAFVRPRAFHQETETDDSLVQTSTSSATGVIVLFTLPKTPRVATQMFTCKSVEMAVTQVRTLLWLVDTVPQADSESISTSRELFRYYFDISGYILLNDEGDGFRITFCSDDSFLSDLTHRQAVADSVSPLDKPVSPKDDILTQQNSWGKSSCDSFSGHVLPSSDALKTAYNDQLSVVSEAFLHVDVLLHDILSNRKGSWERHPEYFFSLLSLQSGGRVASLVIVFQRKQKVCSLGVFVLVDLFTGTYKEQEWVQGKRSESLSLRSWCNKLSINRRMKQLRAGPYSVSEKHPIDWSSIVKETHGIDYDEDDDYDESFWRDWVLGKDFQTARQHSPPKVISMASLYPDCDIISNDALLQCNPVKLMQARDAPLQLRYG